jgi:PhzF family phenazine biosynthesis protein
LFLKIKTYLFMKIYQVDAFTQSIFGGNPAAVVPLETWLPTDTMQKLGNENNLAETVFFIPTDGVNSDFHIRWFTPSIEVRLCGHATLATAHVLYTQLGYDKPAVRFDSLSGILTVSRNADGSYSMDFPADILRGATAAEITIVEQVIGIKPVETWRGKDDFMAIVDSQTFIKNLKPNFAPLKNLDARGLIVTAKGDTADFVSRCFFPEAGIEEDPVTGSAHTTMTPYWAEKLGKTTLSAQQISARHGDVGCVLRGNRVAISGFAATYMIGDFWLP